MNTNHLLQNTTSQQKNTGYSAPTIHGFAIKQITKKAVRHQALYPNNWRLQWSALIKSSYQILTQVNDTPNQARREITSWQNHFLSDLIDLILSPIDLKKVSKTTLTTPNTFVLDAGMCFGSHCFLTAF